MMQHNVLHRDTTHDIKMTPSLFAASEGVPGAKLYLADMEHHMTAVDMQPHNQGHRLLYKVRASKQL